ncbi:unnamed protein product [Owenia fusiformis]|uniref:Uncharacterized protein n=1 Tax=Owenia fusiformis TaxID=6347 RepID=A0A8J1XTV2_OWEFU|nr:unnamed protein product [Owenia fusiformis]
MNHSGINSDGFFRNTTIVWLENSTLASYNVTNSSGVPVTGPINHMVKSAMAIWKYGSPVLVTLGFMFNTMAIVVLLQKNLRRKTSSLYLIALAISDTSVLMNGYLRFWIIMSTDEKLNIRDISQAGCKIMTFLLYLSNQFSAWMLVCITVERLIVVFVPHKARLICTFRSTALTILCVFVVLCIVNMHFFWSTGILQQIQICRWLPGFDFIKNVYRWVDFALGSIIPFIVMIVSNVIIIAKLTCFRRHIQSNQNTSFGRMAVMLVTVNFTFIVLTLPILLYLVHGFDHWYVEDRSRFYLLWACLNLVFYSNNVLNFVMYCISGTDFRSTLRDGICKLFLCCKDCQHLPNSSLWTNLSMGKRTSETRSSSPSRIYPHSSKAPRCHEIEELIDKQTSTV